MQTDEIINKWLEKKADYLSTIFITEKDIQVVEAQEEFTRLTAEQQTALHDGLIARANRLKEPGYTDERINQINGYPDNESALGLLVQPDASSSDIEKIQYREELQETIKNLAERNDNEKLATACDALTPIIIAQDLPIILNDEKITDQKDILAIKEYLKDIIVNLEENHTMGGAEAIKELLSGILGKSNTIENDLILLQEIGKIGEGKIDNSVFSLSYLNRSSEVHLFYKLISSLLDIDIKSKNFDKFIAYYLCFFKTNKELEKSLGLEKINFLPFSVTDEEYIEIIMTSIDKGEKIPRYFSYDRIEAYLSNFILFLEKQDNRFNRLKDIIFSKTIELKQKMSIIGHFCQIQCREYSVFSKRSIYKACLALSKLRDSQDPYTVFSLFLKQCGLSETLENAEKRIIIAHVVKNQISSNNFTSKLSEEMRKDYGFEHPFRIFKKTNHFLAWVGRNYLKIQDELQSSDDDFEKIRDMNSSHKDIFDLINTPKKSPVFLDPYNDYDYDYDNEVISKIDKKLFERRSYPFSQKKSYSDIFITWINVTMYSGARPAAPMLRLTESEQTDEDSLNILSFLNNAHNQKKISDDDYEFYSSNISVKEKSLLSHSVFSFVPNPAHPPAPRGMIITEKKSSSIQYFESKFKQFVNDCQGNFAESHRVINIEPNEESILKIYQFLEEQALSPDNRNAGLTYLQERCNLLRNGPFIWHNIISSVPDTEHSLSQLVHSYEKVKFDDHLFYQIHKRCPEKKLQELKQVLSQFKAKFRMTKLFSSASSLPTGINEVIKLIDKKPPASTWEIVTTLKKTAASRLEMRSCINTRADETQKAYEAINTFFNSKDGQIDDLIQALKKVTPKPALEASDEVKEFSRIQAH